MSVSNLHTFKTPLKTFFLHPPPDYQNPPNWNFSGTDPCDPIIPRISSTGPLSESRSPGAGRYHRYRSTQVPVTPSRSSPIRVTTRVVPPCRGTAWGGCMWFPSNVGLPDKTIFLATSVSRSGLKFPLYDTPIKFCRTVEYFDTDQVWKRRVSIHVRGE